MSDQPSIWSDPMGYFREQAERTAAEAGKDRYGKNNDPGLINNILGHVTGATDAGTQEYRDLETQQQLGKEYNSRLQMYGGGKVELGETEGSVQERYLNLKNEYEAEQRKKGYAELHNSPQQVEERRRRDQQFTTSQQNVADQMELTRLGMQQQNKRFETQLQMQQNNLAEDRAIRAEARADDLALKREQMERADHRYAQELERYDKRKRQDSIQAMVAGLASLGAAFAL